MTHDLKTHPEHFEELWEWRKTFEIRKDDRGYAQGDKLKLREYDPVKNEFSGRLIVYRVPHLLRGPAFGLSADTVVMSLVFVGRTGSALSSGATA